MLDTEWTPTALNTELVHNKSASAHATRELLDYYRAIETASRQMLKAAQDEDWDAVLKLEGTCAVLIEQLRSQAQQQSLPREHRAEKQRIMLSILRHDAAIRQLAEPWIADLDQMFSGRKGQLLH
jgi:flagellar protein FliT